MMLTGRWRPGLLIVSLLLAEGGVLVAMAATGAFLMPLAVSGELANQSAFGRLLGLLFLMRLLWVGRRGSDRSSTPLTPSVQDL